MPFHLANVLFHMLGGLLVYVILRRLIPNLWAPAAGAALFLVHPLQVEAVGWVSGLKDVLGGTLSLAALYCFLRFIDGKKWWYLPATLAFVLAMFAKPACVVVPLLALLSGSWAAAQAGAGVPEHDGTQSYSSLIKNIIRRVLLPLLPWFLLTIPVILEGRRAQPATIVPTVALWMRPLVAADALWFYLAKLLLPIGLCIDYSRTPAAIAHSGALYWTWIFVVAALAAMWLLRRRLPLLLVALLLFFAAPLPVLGFVKFDFQFYSTVSDHYVYLAMLGAALGAAAVLQNWERSPIAWVAAAVMLLGLGIATTIQCGYWKDDFTLFDRAADINPQSFVAHSHLGRVFLERGDMDRAEEHFERAVQIAPDNAAAHRNLGEVLLAQRHPRAAAPELEAALAGQADDAGLHNDLGIALAQSQQYRRAKAQFEQAIRLNPRYLDPRVNLARMSAEQGDFAAAADYYRQALEVDPNSAIARRELAALQARMQRSSP